MKKRLLFIYNPHAGKEKIRSNLLDIIDIMSRAGFEITVHPTMKRGDARVAVREMPEGFDLIICCGGDGTLSETVSGMMKAGIHLPLGYIPAGSTNDFASSLGIPSRMIEAAEAIVKGHLFSCDIGMFNSRYFVYVAAFGLFTEVSYDTDQELKNRLGHTAYILEAARRLGEVRDIHMEVTYDGGSIEDHFMFGMITNSKSVGGIKGITGSQVDLSDGKFEVLLIRTMRTAMEFQEVLKAFFAGKGDEKNVYTFKTSRIRIRSEEEVAWTLDGEYGGTVRNADIVNQKSAVEMMVP